MKEEREPPESFEEQLQRLQPIVHAYRPLLLDIERTIEKEGEASALQMVVSTGANKSLRDLQRLLIANSHDFSAMSPEDLTETASKTAYAVVLIYAPESTVCWEMPDLGKEVPSDFVETLLKREHPYQQFRSALYLTEYHAFCMQEIERRGEKHPEMMALLEYRGARPWRQAQRNALNHLRKMSFEMRASQAEYYGLDWLAGLERDIDKSLLEQIRLQYNSLSIDDYFKDSPKLNQTIHRIQRQFPELEKGLINEYAIASKLSPTEKEGIIKDTGSECDLLVRCTVVRLFGPSQGTQVDQKSIVEDQAFVKLSEILGTGWSANEYKDILDRGLGKEKERFLEYVQGRGLVTSNAEMTAWEGLLEGAEDWAGREVDDIIVAGLKKHLYRSLRKTNEDDLIDATRKEKKHKIHQLTEMDYDGEALKLIHPNGSSTKIKAEKKEIDKEDEATPLFERIHASEFGTEQVLEESEGKALDLKRLGFHMGDLSVKELSLLDELSEAAKKGYTKDSKEGSSLRQLWTDERVYQNKMKMLKRLEAKRKNL